MKTPENEDVKMAVGTGPGKTISSVSDWAEANVTFNPPEVFFFGCHRYPGHFIHAKGAVRPLYESTPWGAILDGGLLYDRTKEPYGPRDSTVDGKYVFAQKGGWSAIAFWDRSGDERGASNSAFLVAAEMTADELLNLARAQWPEIFSRKGFPLKS